MSDSRTAGVKRPLDLIALDVPDLHRVRAAFARRGWKVFLSALHYAQESKNGSWTRLLGGLDPKQVAGLTRKLGFDPSPASDHQEEGLQQALIESLGIDLGARGNRQSFLGTLKGGKVYEQALKHQSRLLRQGRDPRVVQSAIATGVLNWFHLRGHVHPAEVVAGSAVALDEAVVSALTPYLRGATRHTHDDRRVLVIGDASPSMKKALLKAGLSHSYLNTRARTADDVQKAAQDIEADLVVIGDPTFPVAELERLMASRNQSNADDPAIVVDVRSHPDGWSAMRASRSISRDEAGATASRSVRCRPPTVVLGRIDNELATPSGVQLDAAVFSDGDLATSVRDAYLRIGGYRQSDAIRTALVVLGAGDPRRARSLIEERRARNVDRLTISPLSEYLKAPAGAKTGGAHLMLEEMIRGAWLSRRPGQQVPNVALVAQLLAIALPHMEATRLQVTHDLSSDRQVRVAMSLDQSPQRFDDAMRRLENLLEPPGWISQWVKAPSAAVHGLQEMLGREATLLPPPGPNPKERLESAPPSITTFNLEFNIAGSIVFHQAAFQAEWSAAASETRRDVLHDMVVDEVASWLGLELTQHRGVVSNTPTAGVRDVLEIIRDRPGGLSTPPSRIHQHALPTCALLNPGSWDVGDDALSMGYAKVITPGQRYNKVLDVDASIALIERHRPRVALLKTPYNMFGDSAKAEDIERLVKKCEDAGTILVVDNSHGALTLHDRGNEMTRALLSSPNCIVLGNTARVPDVPKYSLDGSHGNHVEMTVAFLPSHLAERRRRVSATSLDVSSARAAAAMTRAMRTSGLGERATKAVREQMFVRDHETGPDGWMYHPGKRVIGPPARNRKPDWSQVTTSPSVAGSSEIIIVGGGPVGLSIAGALALEGRSITVIDNGQGAFRTAGGQHIVVHENATDGLMRLAEAGVPIFQALARVPNSGVADRLYCEPVGHGDFWTPESAFLMTARKVRPRQTIVIQPKGIDGVPLDCPREEYPSALSLESWAMDTQKMMRYFRARLRAMGVNIVHGRAEPNDIENNFGRDEPALIILAAGTKTPELLGIPCRQEWLKGGLSFRVRPERPVPLQSVSAGDYLVNVIDPRTVLVGGLQIDNPPPGPWKPNRAQIEQLRHASADLVEQVGAHIPDIEVMSPGVILHGDALDSRGDNRLSLGTGPVVVNHPDPALSERVIGTFGHAGLGLVLAPGTALEQVMPVVGRREFAPTGMTVGV